MSRPDRRSRKRHPADQPTLFVEEPEMPYGLLDLDPTLTTDRGPTLRIRCVVRDCPHLLIPPTRSTAGQVCPVHGIRVHQSGTFTYRDATRNFIVDAKLVTRIIRHPGKFESHRLGYEKSEDAVTLNVFRSFQEAGCLNEVARLITGLEVADEPELFLWGIGLNDDALPVWPLLQAARQRFEKVLPVKRPATEPDIGLFLDGHYLALIEAKLTSPNTFYFAGPRKDAQSLTKDELLTLYHDKVCTLLDLERAKGGEAVAYQMWRNTVFAEWMTHHAKPGTKAYFANLVRAGYEIESFEHFHRIVRPEFADRVTRIRWEDLYLLASIHGNRLLRLREYMAAKTCNLQPAFLLAAV
jgi:hypothetical protein